MLLLISLALLLLTALIMLIVQLARPGFAHHWLIATIGALVAWPLALLARPQLPRTIDSLAWQPAAFFPVSPALRVDEVSWAYALAVATLSAAVILTAVTRQQLNWRAWAGALTLAGFGMLAVLAGNPLTLLLAWAALDMIELLIILAQVKSGSVHERAVVSFAARLMGIGMLALALLNAQARGIPLTFAAIPPEVSLHLLLAAGLRLGVLPLQVPFLHEPPLRRGLGTSLRLMPLASSLMLLTRTAAAGVPGVWAPYLLALTVLAALFGAIGFLLVATELNGRIPWILGTAALAVAATINSSPEASLAWGLALILPGGFVFLLSARHRNLLPLAVLSVLALSGLPFTPLWIGSLLFPFPSSYISLILSILLSLAQVLLLLGYLRHALRLDSSGEGLERWVWLVYPAGLVLIVLTHWLLGWLERPALDKISLTGWWGGAITLGLATFLWLASRRIPRSLRPGLASALGRVFSLSWLYRLLWVVYRSVGRLVALITLLLEGEGGLLWAFLLLVLMVSLLTQGGG
jgi:hypothetical protein